MSINDIRRRIKQEKRYYPAQSTVYQWIDKFTDRAVKHYESYCPKVGDTWIADETLIDIDGKDIWLWDIIDEDTRFLLATKMSYTRTSEDARILFELAKRRAGKEPDTIVTDKLRAYPDGISRALPETFHKQSRPFTSDNSTNRIERFHSTLKERTKVMRGLKDVNSALAFIDGFLAYYNFIRPHYALGGKTPAEAAGISYDVKSWTGIIKLGEPSRVAEAESELEKARKTITGKPYKVGRKRKVRKVLNPEAKIGKPQEFQVETVTIESKTPSFEATMPDSVKKVIFGNTPKGLR
jgi:transposase-like protein